MHHGVSIADSALVAAAALSDRYITERFLPDKATDPTQPDPAPTPGPCTRAASTLHPPCISPRAPRDLAQAIDLIDEAAAKLKMDATSRPQVSRP